MAEYAQGSDQEQGSPLPPLPDVEVLGVGEALRKRREQLGWSIGDVAAWLRIRSVYLEALENGNASVLPAEVYALGFLRAYGRLSGLIPTRCSSFIVRKGGWVRASRIWIFPIRRQTAACRLLLAFLLGWPLFWQAMWVVLFCGPCSTCARTRAARCIPDAR